MGGFGQRGGYLLHCLVEGCLGRDEGFDDLVQFRGVGSDEVLELHNICGRDGESGLGGGSFGADGVGPGAFLLWWVVGREGEFEVGREPIT